MTNKPMLSVERELLERAASAIEKHHGSLQWVIASDLRAIIDKPVNFLTPDCPDCACVQDGQCLCIPSKPAAQHQGEPVAWRYKKSWEKKGWKICDKHPTDYGIDDECYEIQALYAESPAPVAVVMPEHTMRSVMDAIQQARGFPMLTSNQCHALAESLNYVARLNGVKP